MWRVTDIHPLAPAADAAELPAPPRYRNREATWLEFNGRVLALARAESMPLLERVRFLAIAANNLDDFCQVRGAVLMQNLEAGLPAASPEGLSASEQLELFRSGVRHFHAALDQIFAEEILPGLEAQSLHLSDYHELDADDRRFLDAFFAERVFPVLTPLAVDPAHPFPYISSMALNLVVVVGDPEAGQQRIARVKLPPSLPRFVVLPDGGRFVPLEQVIAGHLDALFPGMDIIAHHSFRLTRGADFQLDSDEDDLLEAVRDVLKRRRLSPLVVRLEADASMPDEIRDLLVRELEMNAEDVILTSAPVGLAGLMSLHSLDRPELKYPPWASSVPQRVLKSAEGGGRIFDAIRDGDLLVQHPYEDFGATVEEFIEQAADDPHVLAIKQTLYRTSGRISSIIRALVRAADSGKQVVALVELTARFDEQANISWAQTLEESGVHVIYGTVGLKTHAKVTLVVRSEGDRIMRYCHIGTGNYNPETARIYEDIGLLTADDEVCSDVSELFNALSGYSRYNSFRRLVVAPEGIRRHMVERIGEQAYEGGRITIKVNGFIDPELIDCVYDAAEAGATIDLIVRGMCGLNPGVLSEAARSRLRIRSIVGRYLEHSRIFRFGDGEDADYWIGSADLMQRNLDRRVEVLVPIKDFALRRRLDEILRACLDDDLLAWSLSAGGWTKVPTVHGLDAQAALQEASQRRNRPALTAG